MNKTAIKNFAIWARRELINGVTLRARRYGITAENTGNEADKIVNGQVLTNGGTFDYENRSLQYSMKKQVEYTGNETPVSMFWNISEFLCEGTYKVSIFADGHMIGSRSFTF